MRIACIVAVVLIGWFDYLYVMRLLDNWEAYMVSPMADRLRWIYYLGAAGYASLNLLIGLIFYWCWKE